MAVHKPDEFSVCVTKKKTPSDKEVLLFLSVISFHSRLDFHDLNGPQTLPPSDLGLL